MFFWFMIEVWGKGKSYSFLGFGRNFFFFFRMWGDRDLRGLFVKIVVFFRRVDWSIFVFNFDNLFCVFMFV